MKKTEDQLLAEAYTKNVKERTTINEGHFDAPGTQVVGIAQLGGGLFNWRQLQTAADAVASDDDIEFEGDEVYVTVPEGETLDGVLSKLLMKCEEMFPEELS